MSDARPEDPASRRERLVAVYREASVCTRCPLHETRTSVVFGAGDADAELMLVGEAPGADEDRRGLPFVGRAGQLLGELLAGIGLSRDDVFIANTLKCLRYTARVQLGDGSWERIGRLVRDRYDGEVMSVAEDGSVVPRRVVDWHATPVGERSVHRLTFRSAKREGPRKSSVELTGDHEVLTGRGYVPAAELKSTDLVATGQGLSELAFDIVCGSLLGDASISTRGAGIQMAHSVKQAAYVAFKADLLSELVMTQQEFAVAAVVGGPTYGTIHAWSRAHRALRLLRSEFYGPKKRVPEWMERMLTPRMVAFWFMDDGHMRIRRGGRRPMADISTDAFSQRDLQVLIRGLARLGLAAKAGARNRLYFNVEHSARLSELIAPYVPPSMRYKLAPDVERRVPFRPARLTRGRVLSLFDRVEIEDVTGRPRADVTFFCIDVDENHNFVTAGGVVHNCRPPGNRDPLPAEVETCSPFLNHQIELIQPKVVATLGNFATKRLTGDPTGITRVRGTPQVHQLGGRPVFVLPLIHPAAALRTQRMKELLVEDFGRLRELLAGPPPELPGGEAADTGEEAPPGGDSRAAAEPDTEQLDIFGGSG